MELFLFGGRRGKAGQQDMVVHLMNQLPWSLLIQHPAESDLNQVIYLVLVHKMDLILCKYLIRADTAVEKFPVFNRRLTPYASLKVYSALMNADNAGESCRPPPFIAGAF